MSLRSPRNNSNNNNNGDEAEHYVFPLCRNKLSRSAEVVKYQYTETCQISTAVCFPFGSLCDLSQRIGTIVEQLWPLPLSSRRLACAPRKMCFFAEFSSSNSRTRCSAVLALYDLSSARIAAVLRTRKPYFLRKFGDSRGTPPAFPRSDGLFSLSPLW